jgi:hypothetical protein
MLPLIPKVLLTQSADNKTIGGVFDKLRERLNDVPFLHGQLLSVTVGTSPTEIGHTLGRVWQGYLVLSQNANAVIWAPSAPSATSLTLQSSAAVAVKLWVF